MKFDPSQHSKEFLLANIQALNSLVINSDEFANSKLASDPDILQQMILNSNPPESPAVGTTSSRRPNPEDLGLLSEDFAYPELQRETNWSASEKSKDLALPAEPTQNKKPNTEDLSLLSSNPVYPELQNETDWSVSEKSKNLGLLSSNDLNKQEQTNGQKTSFAHALAMRSSSWVNNSEFARSKKALYTLDQQGVSVAERMSSLSIDQIAMRFISIGATFKISGPDSLKFVRQDSNNKNGVTNEQIKIIAHETMDLVEESLDPLVGATIGSAGYSTLHHLKAAMDSLSASPEKLKATNMTPQEIQSLIKESERSLELLQKVVIDKVRELRLNSDSSVKLQVNPFSEPAIQLIRNAISPKPNSNNVSSIENKEDNTFEFKPN